MTRDELLTLLIEECAEVIQAATNCQRFGWERLEPGYGKNNEVLAFEVGDVIGVIEQLDLSFVHMNRARTTKIERAERAKRERSPA